MKLAYASRTGNVESIIKKLGYNETIHIQSGNESVLENYVLFTYTDGYGDIPREVENFLSNNSSYLQGVVVSGDTGYGDAYCQAGDKIAEMFGVKCLLKVENEGTDSDIQLIQEILVTL